MPRIWVTVSEEVKRKMKKPHRVKVKRGLDVLSARGLARRHPTSGGMTYHFTSLGLHVVELFEKADLIKSNYGGMEAD